MDTIFLQVFGFIEDSGRSKGSMQVDEQVRLRLSHESNPGLGIAGGGLRADSWDG